MTWKGAAYAVDWTGAERERLSRLRVAQGGISVDELVRVVQLMRRVDQGVPSPAKARDEIAAIVELEKALGRPRGLEEVTEPLELTRVLPQARRELERVRGPRDRDRVDRAVERLGQTVEWLSMHLLLSLAYTPYLGDPSGPAAKAGDPSIRHRFGVHEVTEGATPWTVPFEVDGTGVVTGAILGLDHALASLSLRRVPVATPPRATLLTPANLHALALQVALASPGDATAPQLQEVVAALTRGRQRVREARGDVAVLDALAAAGSLSADRRSLLGWAAVHDPERIERMFTLAELARIGGPGTALPDGFGTPTLALDTRLRLAWRASEPWEPFSGRPSLGLLASLTPELPLRIAELTVLAELPPEVYPGVLAFAVQDLIDSADLTSSEDWLGLVHHAGALTRERFDDYVSALAGLGILSPAGRAGR